jgi:hypothetical protein
MARTTVASLSPMLASSQFRLALAAIALATCSACTAPFEAAPADPRWLVYPSGDGPGAGKRVVFVAGDEEYRSEESLPMLARLLSAHFGFESVVLFSQNPDTGEIDPNQSSNIPGLELIDEADLLVLLLRFRELPDPDMAHIVNFVEAGKPLIGMRTATHAFHYKKNRDSKYAKWTWNSKDPAGGFGREILGETWVAHHGHHGSEATRGVINSDFANHPALRGVTDVFGTTDVYAIRDLPADAQILLNGSVLDGMTADAQPVEGPKNSPMHPVAWLRLREIATPTGPVTQRIFATTMGAAPDWSSHDLRRLFFNAAFWTLGMEDQIPSAGLKAEMIGEWTPSNFGFNQFRSGLHPADYRNGTP